MQSIYCAGYCARRGFGYDLYPLNTDRAVYLYFQRIFQGDAQW